MFVQAGGVSEARRPGPTLFLPVTLSVSRLISSQISLKSKNFWSGRCRNSPHSSPPRPGVRVGGVGGGEKRFEGQGKRVGCLGFRRPRRGQQAAPRGFTCGIGVAPVGGGAGLRTGGLLDELEHQRTARHNPDPARQEAPADNVLEDRALATGLRSDDHHLRQVQRRLRGDSGKFKGAAVSCLSTHRCSSSLATRHSICYLSDRREYILQLVHDGN